METESGTEHGHADIPLDPAPPVRVRRRWRRWLLRSVAILVVVALMGIATVVGLLWAEHRSALTLPTPTGSFPVGRVEYDWVDHSRTDPLAPVAGRPRELVVWIWYPAAPHNTSRPVDYQPVPLANALARYQGPVLSTFLTRDPTVVRAHSIQPATIAPAQPAYPVVLLRSGIGAEVTDYTTLAEDLASHGYVVVGMDAPYSTSVVVFPDGRVVTKSDTGNPADGNNTVTAQQNHALDKLITVWTADTRFVLDRLTNSTPPTLPGCSPTGST